MLCIMKFGGTSLNTREHRLYAIGKIKKQLKKNNKVLVVVSAMGRNEEPYSTNSLLRFTEHLPQAQKDRLVAQGEILSSLVFENECRNQGISAHACTPTETGIITDDRYQAARVLQVNPLWIHHYLQEMEVVIVPGFIGISMSGHITTLGRGGSDKTAILLADSLDVQQVKIYTDVDGIYNCDPKGNEDAKRHEALTFDECLALVNAGACVMMKESVELAKSKGILFTVSSTFKEGLGTKVGGKITEV